MENYLLKDKLDIVKSYSKDLLNRLDIIIDNLPMGSTLDLQKELDFYRIEASEKNVQSLLYTMILLNYMRYNLKDLTENFHLFKNIKIDTTIFSKEDIKDLIDSSLDSNSFEAFNFVVNNFDKNKVSEILNETNNNGNYFLSYCRNINMDIKILELIEKNELMDFNNIKCYGKEYPLMDIIGNKRNQVFAHTLNEKLFKYLYENNYNLNINDLHIKYRQIYTNIEKAYEKKDKNEKNLSELLVCMKDAFDVPNDIGNINLVDNIVNKLDSFKKLILDYQKEINLGNLYEMRLSESKEISEIVR